MAKNKMARKGEQNITIDLSKDFNQMLRRNNRFLKKLSK